MDIIFIDIYKEGAAAYGHPYLLISIKRALAAAWTSIFIDINKEGAAAWTFIFIDINKEGAAAWTSNFIDIYKEGAAAYGHPSLLISIKRALSCFTWTLPKQFIMIIPYYYLLMTVLYLFSHPN